jgi:radical SAM protein with 4Fe4S-binding SPASM domain
MIRRIEQSEIDPIPAGPQFGPQYAEPCAEQFTGSDDPDKSPGRASDGEISSAAYVTGSPVLAGDGGAIGVDYHHPLEDLIPRPWFRWILRRISAAHPRGTALERILGSYANPSAPWLDRLKFFGFHLMIDRLRGRTPRQTVRRNLYEHTPTVRGLVVTARSLAEFGLTRPQRFSMPLFCVWNLTNRCNLRCRHCYQSSDHARLADELTLAEKLDVVDQLGAAYVPMLALAGGEPTICPDLLPVLRRAQQHRMHTTIATNGVTMTEALAAQLAEAGVKYVEISLDSVDPSWHDAFRGSPGMWARAVRGMRAVVSTPGLRLGVAMCVHRGNLREVRDMIEFAIDIGAGCFAHFNFIPIGRGLDMVSGDLTPREREELLELLNEYMQSGRIGIISTAPQFARVCLAHSPVETGRAACSHAGAGTGVKARVVAKYLGGCGAGRTYICLEPNGDVTPCVYLPHRVMGNVRERPIEQIFRESVLYDVLNDRDRRLDHCEVCAFKNYCGGCRARADAYTGQLHGGDPGCLFNSRQWDRLVDAGVVDDSPGADPATMDLTPTRHGPA